MRMMKVAAMLALSASAIVAQETRPLEASLRRGASEPVFYLNQPAYVAVFEVVPGVGVQQLYPRTSAQASRPTEAGEYLLSRPFRSNFGYSAWTPGMPYARPMYLVDQTGRVVSYYYSTAYSAYSSGLRYDGRTRTLLLVASRLPLRRVTTPDAARSWLQTVIGFQAVSASLVTSDNVLNDITDAILPLGAGVDDVVADIMDVAEYGAGPRMFADNIVFSCPVTYSTTQIDRSLVNMAAYLPADYNFASGIFYCPAITHTTTVATNPGTPQPPDSGSSTPEEGIKLPHRRPGPDYNREEGFAQVRRVAGSPAAGVSEEGFAMHRRGVAPQPTGSATFATGVPMSSEGFTARQVGRIGAWTPPVPGMPVNVEMTSRTGRSAPAGGGYDGYQKYDGVRSTSSSTYSGGVQPYTGTSTSTPTTTTTTAAPATEGAVQASHGVTSKMP